MDYSNLSDKAIVKAAKNYFREDKIRVHFATIRQGASCSRKVLDLNTPRGARLAMFMLATHMETFIQVEELRAVNPKLSDNELLFAWRCKFEAPGEIAAPIYYRFRWERFQK